MYLPRPLLSTLYTSLVARTHPLSAPILLLVALTPDALCAAQILTALLKRDYIPHKVQPVSGYTELAAAGRDLVQPLTRQHGGDGGVVVCLGTGGLVDLEEVLGLDPTDEQGAQDDHGVEVWVFDSRRPWNLANVFGTRAKENTEAKRTPGISSGRILRGYQAGRGGIIVYDDGDIETELGAEKEAFCTLMEMPELGEDEDFDDDGGDDEDDEDETVQDSGRKRKFIDRPGEADDSADDDERRMRRRRSNSGSAIPSSPLRHHSRRDIFEMSNHPSSSRHDSSPPPQSSPPIADVRASARALRRKLLRLRRKHEATLTAYYALGTSYAEPLSSLLYNLAEELGREDNDMLWLAIVGMTSVELFVADGMSKSASSSLSRTERIRAVLQDEVRRLNPTPASDIALLRSDSETSLPTTARSPTDNSIRLSPEPRFLLTRHWSLYESMLHSPYLSSRLHIWSEAGRKRLDRLLTKMGISLDEARRGYTHMDMDLKRTLRQRILKFAPMYGLDGLIPPQSRDKEGWGFVRCWGWRACLSAADVAVIVSAILEVGAEPGFALTTTSIDRAGKDSHRMMVSGSYASRVRSLPTPESSPSHHPMDDAITDPDYTTNRFYAAFDALTPGGKSLGLLLAHVDTAKHLHAAILRTGSALMNKHQIRHLRAFRMGVVREGPDVPLFCHPGALAKLANWVAEAVGVLEAERGTKEKGALVLGALDEARGVYVVVGLGGGGAAGMRVKTRAEMREKEERARRKKEVRERRRLEKIMKREKAKRLRQEREEANGIFRDEYQGSDGSESEEDEDEDEDDSDSDEEDAQLVEKRKKRGYGLNRFGAAFQEVVEETSARVRIDSFEHAVVEVNKEDFSGFLEALSLKTVVG